MHKDKAFAEKFKGIDDQKKIIALAKKSGYKITEQDLNDLKMEAASGGNDDIASWLFSTLKNGIGEIKRIRKKQQDFEKADFSNAPKIGAEGNENISSFGDGGYFGPSISSGNENSGPPRYM